MLEGVYAARPELADLVGLRLLVVTNAAEREVGLIAREGMISPWERQWHAAEHYHFARIMPPATFDLTFDAAAEVWHVG